MMKRRCKTTDTQEIFQCGNQNVKDSFPDSDELVAEAELIISINELSEEEIITIN